MLEIIEHIGSLVETIRDVVKEVGANQERSELLAHRAEMIMQQVKRLQTSFQRMPKHYTPLLKELHILLTECVAFVKSFNIKHFLKKILFCGTYAEKFDDFSQRLQQCSLDLQLGLQIETVFNQYNDQVAAENDNRKIQEIIQQNKQQLELAQDAKQGIDIILQRLDQMILGSASEKAKTSKYSEQTLARYYQINTERLVYDKSCNRDDLFEWFIGRYLKQSVLIKKVIALSAGTQQTFLRDVAVVSRLQHPNILSFYGACFIAGQQCIVHEALGNTVHCALQKNPALSDVLGWLSGLANALYYLHSKQIIHGNLNPNAVVISLDGCAMLTGFGFSQTQASTVQALGSAKGSIASNWLAPERVHHYSAQASKEADVYSFGLLCWLMVLKKADLPAGYNLSSTETYQLAMLAELPPTFAALIAQCWWAPEARISMDDLVIGLEALRKSSLQGAPAERAAHEYKAGLQKEQRKDYIGARMHYEAAVTLNHLKAKTNLGVFHAKGRGGLPKNEVKAFQLFFDAAQPTSGVAHNRAMFNLAVCFQKGRGVAVDSERASYWHQQATAAGFKQG